MVEFKDEPNENVMMKQVIKVLLERCESIYMNSFFKKKIAPTLEELTKRFQL
jgi:hypothetical protein